MSSEQRVGDPRPPPAIERSHRHIHVRNQTANRDPKVANLRPGLQSIGWNCSLMTHLSPRCLLCFCCVLTPRLRCRLPLTWPVPGAAKMKRPLNTIMQSYQKCSGNGTHNTVGLIACTCGGVSYQRRRASRYRASCTEQSFWVNIGCWVHHIIVIARCRVHRWPRERMVSSKEPQFASVI